jgi:hypothetical protein
MRNKRIEVPIYHWCSLGGSEEVKFKTENRNRKLETAKQD